MIMPRNTVTFLHISDIHFGSPTDPFGQKMVLKSLIQAIKAEMQKGWRPDFIVCTGDIAWSGLGSQYFNLAVPFLNDLLEATEIKDPQRVFTVPGNHDVDETKIDYTKPIFIKDENKSIAFFEKSDEAKLLERVIKHFGGYSEFLRDYFGRCFDYQHYFLCEVVKVGEVSVDVIGLNSAWLSRTISDVAQRRMERGKLVLGLRCLERAFAYLKEIDKSTMPLSLKIVMFHHPISYLCDFEDSKIRDYLAINADLCLQGHKECCQSAKWDTF